MGGRSSGKSNPKPGKEGGENNGGTCLKWGNRGVTSYPNNDLSSQLMNIYVKISGWEKKGGEVKAHDYSEHELSSERE